MSRCGDDMKEESQEKYKRRGSTIDTVKDRLI